MEKVDDMERLFLQQLLCQQIFLEKEAFKRSILNKEKADIYAAAYEIDCKITIYEQMVEMSQDMEVMALCSVVTLPDILAYFYAKWLEKEDSAWKELRECLTEEIRKRTEMPKEQERTEAG